MHATRQPEGGIVAVQAGSHSIGSRSLMIDKRLKLMGVRNPDSIPDPGPFSRVSFHAFEMHVYVRVRSLMSAMFGQACWFPGSLMQSD
eukprot:2128150-Rhodomonas_salina.2